MTLFETMERSALLPLPEFRYVFAEWKKARVNIDYHVELHRHYYSVPYTLAQEEVEVRYTTKTVEIFCRGKRVASHMRDDRPGKHTTLEEHMPKSHQKYLSAARQVWESSIAMSVLSRPVAGRLPLEHTAIKVFDPF